LVHDFANILTGIIGVSDTLLSEPPLDEAARNGMSLIRETALRGSQLAQSMRQLQQAAPGEASYCELNQLVSDMAALLQKVLPRRIRVKIELATGQLPLYVDAVLLQQTIINLVLSAADAMPDGGELTFVTARHEHVPEPVKFQGKGPHARQICLSFRNTGRWAERISPGSGFGFFAGASGRFSGLGMRSARRFAETQNAGFSIESDGGKETTVHLWFPEAGFDEESVQKPAGRGRQTLLLAGPPGRGLETTAKLLQEAGYYVVCARDQASATEIVYSPCFELTGLIALTASEQSELISLCERVRAHKLPIKTVIVLTDEADAGLEQKLTGAAGAVLSAMVGRPDFLVRLQSVLKDT